MLTEAEVDLEHHGMMASVESHLALLIYPYEVGLSPYPPIE